MDLVTLALVALSAVGSFAAIGGAVAYAKRRRPLEGLLLGATLGPVGLILVWTKPFGHRPMIDRGAQTSFRSLVQYQSSRILLHLPESATKPSHRPMQLEWRRTS